MRRPGTHRLVLGTRPRQERHLVRPDPPEPGEPVAIKVYRTMRSAGAYTETVAYDDDLTADTL